MKIHFPGKLVFGKNTLEQLPDEVTALSCTRALVVTITPLLGQLKGFVSKLEASGVQVQTNTSIVNEPSFAEVQQLLQEVKGFNPDVVIGIGGGSVLDVAKVTAALLENEQGLKDIVGIGFLKSRPKKLICMPTTSGTGSEVSPNSILVDETDNQKKGIISPFLVPDIVYVDPLLTMGVPAAITAATGIDALTHCLEAYTNLFAHPFIDVYAYEGMRLIAANIVQAVQNGNDEEARTQVAMGSLLGGFCLGPVNTAGVHALSYPLGSAYHLAHGLSNALLLPYVMEFNYVAAPKRYADVAVALGCEREADDVKTALKGIDKIRSLISACGIPARLRDVGIPKEAIPQMAVDAMKITRLLKNNPRPITEKDAIDIFNAAY
ncbi:MULTISPECIES: iron-containing alcohol dehydrogenase [Niastella]|uniref:Iron-containing alcohol dehydrogenase n=1 Tax=Niastella soli TaxID=2821487 RepID=A0ABS3Z1Y6_9BACT|nr:iron-containing alcohol dehydrogenase [Niastella soli]MBO9204058.1 iron-containing alcohol dehydrogenase [Niastella soli]